ncbi:phage tail assembly protein [Thioalkalivibrio sulfidiphilus]|uniref:phage tail assembly protein n=1 Tax=Thioalkalivibrio sulfidiphilus TaxID=1033854 RepID=UPI003B36BD0D
MAKTEITLEFPVERDGKRLETLSMRRPTVGDELAAGKHKSDPAEREVSLFANLCEVAPQTIHALDMVDYGQLQEVYQGFLSGRRSKPEPAS